MGLSAYSWVNSKKLTEDIAELARPKRKTALINEIDARLSKLTTLYLQRKIGEIDVETHNQLVDDLKESIVKLNELYIDSMQMTSVSLSAIPLLLDSIKISFQDIAILKDEFQQNFNSRIIKQININLESADIRDLVMVENSLSTEITRIIEKDITMLDDSVKEESKNIFQRLFSKKSEPAEPTNQKLQKVKLDTTQIKTDSVFSTTFDTLQMQEGIEELKFKISKILQVEQVKSEEIWEKEKELYVSTVGLISNLEEIIFDYQTGERDRFRELADKTVLESDFYQKYILTIIGLFGLVSIILLGLLMRDINRIRYYQKLLEDNKRQITIRFEQKQRFLNTLSHELRTPLTAIIGFAELLESKDSENRQAILSNSKYLLEMANEILDFAKLEANKIEVNKVPTNIHGFMKNIEANMAAIIKQANLKAYFEYPKDDLWVLIDPLRMQQVIYNLVHNAVKFTNEGSVGCKMEIGGIANNKVQLNFSIVDTGIGIGAEEMDLIFTDYQQAGTHKNKSKGTGLGLGIVQRLVELMDGELKVESELGKGSCFTINLSVEKTLPIEHSENFVAEIGEAQLSANQDKHILVVDDDDYILRLYEKVIGGFNYKISTLNNPLEVASFLRKHQVDMLITDIRMPEKDGITLVKELKAGGLLPRKAVYCSANIQLENEITDGTERLFDGFLLKPFSQRDIFLMLQRMFETDGHIIEVSKVENLAVEGEIDFSDIYTFTMNDASFFDEIINDYYAINGEELKKLQGALGKKQLAEAAELVHKLASRFGQIKANGQFDPMQIENQLRENQSSIIEEAKQLCDFWMKMNELMKQKMMDSSTS